MKYSTLRDFVVYLQKLSDIPSSVLLQGSDAFEIEEACKLLKENLGSRPISFVRSKKGAFQEALISPSLFVGSKTAVIIEDADRLKSQELEALKRHIARPHPGIVCILLATALSPSSELFKLIASQGVVLS